MTTDPISDLIIGIKNAGLAKKEEAIFPYSKLKFEILNVLKKEGFVKSFDKSGKGVKKSLAVEVAYEGSRPKVHDVKRISKPSKRVYFSVSDIKPVKYGKGLAIMSTPKGIMTGKMAVKENVGGEILFNIW